MAEFARAGQLVALDDVLDLAAMNEQYGRSWIDLATVDGKVYGVFIKAALKGLIWYNPKYFSGPAPTIWDAVMATDPAPAQALWCVGLESGAASGWPGTDWIEEGLRRKVRHQDLEAR